MAEGFFIYEYYISIPNAIRLCPINVIKHIILALDTLDLQNLDFISDEKLMKS